MLSKFSRMCDSLRVVIFYIFVLTKITLMQSQSDNSSSKNYYQLFDKAVSIENSGLYNGLIYTEKHRMMGQKQKFFYSTDFLKGSIEFDGQSYFDVLMKYDVNEDQVLIKLNKVLLLKKAKVKSFSIEGHNFENFNSRDHSSPNINGFIEVLLDNEPFQFIKKHKKEMREKLGNKLVFHEFDDKSEYFLLYQNQYHRISKRKEIIKVFPDLKSEIKKQFPKPRRKSNLEAYLTSVLSGIHLMMSNEKEKIIE